MVQSSFFSCLCVHMYLNTIVEVEVEVEVLLVVSILRNPNGKCTSGEQTYSTLSWTLL